MSSISLQNGSYSQTSNVDAGTQIISATNVNQTQPDLSMLAKVIEPAPTNNKSISSLLSKSITNSITKSINKPKAGKSFVFADNDHSYTNGYQAILQNRYGFLVFQTASARGGNMRARRSLRYCHSEFCDAYLSADDFRKKSNIKTTDPAEYCKYFVYCNKCINLRKPTALTTRVRNARYYNKILEAKSSSTRAETVDTSRSRPPTVQIVPQPTVLITNFGTEYESSNAKKPGRPKKHQVLNGQPSFDYTILGCLPFIEKDVVFRMFDRDSSIYQIYRGQLLNHIQTSQISKINRYTLVVVGDDAQAYRDQCGDLRGLINQISLEQLFQHKVLDVDQQNSRVRFTEIAGKALQFDGLGMHAFTRRYETSYCGKQFKGYCLYLSLQLVTEWVWCSYHGLDWVPKFINSDRFAPSKFNALLGDIVDMLHLQNYYQPFTRQLVYLFDSKQELRGQNDYNAAFSICYTGKQQAIKGPWFSDKLKDFVKEHGSSIGHFNFRSRGNSTLSSSGSLRSQNMKPNYMLALFYNVFSAYLDVYRKQAQLKVPAPAEKKQSIQSMIIKNNKKGQSQLNFKSFKKAEEIKFDPESDGSEEVEEQENKNQTKKYDAWMEKELQLAKQNKEDLWIREEIDEYRQQELRKNDEQWKILFEEYKKKYQLYLWKVHQPRALETLQEKCKPEMSMRAFVRHIKACPGCDDCLQETEIPIFELPVPAEQQTTLTNEKKNQLSFN